MKISNPMMCTVCGRGFEIVLSVCGINVVGLGHEGDVEIYKSVIVPAGDPAYVRKHWDCPRCSVLKEREDVARWLVGE